jgi:hypothetical protein
MVARMKTVAAARSLPYHALARSWIMEGLRSGAPQANTASAEQQTEQLNIKLDQEALDKLKLRSDLLRYPYHRLAREWIEVALGREEESLGLDPTLTAGPTIKELMVLLLHATSKDGEDAIRGVTRLQKLLFVLEQKLGAQQSRFYAYNFGPFNEEVNDAADALRLAGFLRGGEPGADRLPSFAEMMATVVERSGPREKPEGDEFSLSSRGHQAAEQLRQSSSAYEQLFAYVRFVREEWDVPELIERVYDEYPKYAERSVIRDQIATRGKRRSR